MYSKPLRDVKRGDLINLTTGSAFVVSIEKLRSPNGYRIIRLTYINSKDEITTYNGIPDFLIAIISGVDGKG